MDARLQRQVQQSPHANEEEDASRHIITGGVERMDADILPSRGHHTGSDSGSGSDRVVNEHHTTISDSPLSIQTTSLNSPHPTNHTINSEEGEGEEVNLPQFIGIRGPHTITSIPSGGNQNNLLLARPTAAAVGAAGSVDTAVGSNVFTTTANPLFHYNNKRGGGGGAAATPTTTGRHVFATGAFPTSTRAGLMSDMEGDDLSDLNNSNNNNNYDDADDIANGRRTTRRGQHNGGRGGSVDNIHATADNHIINKYAMHKYLLYFLDPEVEQRYFNFQYVDNAFIPGKIFGVMWTGIFSISIVTFTQPLSDGASYTIQAFTSPWWIGSYISAIVCGVLLIGLFIDRLRPYREIFHLLQVAVGWPTMILELLILKRPDIFPYGNLQGSYYFCMVIAQARISRSLPLMTIWPTACLFAVTFGVPEYWDNHTKVEMLYWAESLTPAFILFFLEKLTRSSFIDREVANAAIAEIEHKTLVTQHMIANFFPATPTRDLLLTVPSSSLLFSSLGINGGILSHKGRDKFYKDVVLIVTDIEMFTAYTSCSTPTVVVRLLSHMFQEIDEAAEMYGVEKIATVGDSYCGAIFHNSATATTTSSSPAAQSASTTTDILNIINQTVSDRCQSGVLFSLATLPTTGRHLQLRVGVHIGDVIGIFVGCAPPKFDLFGAGIDHARVMEEEGKPSLVHVSHALLDAADVSPMTVDALPRTPYGVLCRSWVELAGVDASSVHSQRTTMTTTVSDDDLEVRSNTNTTTTTTTTTTTASPSSLPPTATTTTLPPPPPSKDPKRIVEALCALANIEPPVDDSMHQEDVASTPIVVDAAPTNANHKRREDDEKKKHLDEKIGEKVEDEEGGDPFEFSKFFLTFKKPAVEEQFQIVLKESGIACYCARVLLMQALVLFIIQHNIMCGTKQDLAIASAEVAILAGMGIYIHFTLANTPYHFAITFTVYNILQIITFLGLRTDCADRLEQQPRYVSDIAVCFTGIALYAPQYCLDVKLVYRSMASLTTGFIFAMCMIIRGYVVGDNVALLDPNPMYSGVFCIMSYLPEYFLRSAFQTELRLSNLRMEAQSRSAAMSTSALSIMLPTFVTERLVQIASSSEDRRGDGGASASHQHQEHSRRLPTHFGKHNGVFTLPVAISPNTRNPLLLPSLVSPSSTLKGTVDDIDFKKLSATWEYNHVVVMFASFTTSSTTSTLSSSSTAINTIINHHHSSPSPLTPNVINLTIQAVEQVVQKFRVKKVKTIGSTIMLVAGVDDPRSREEQVTGMVEAAVMIRSSIFQPMATTTMCTTSSSSTLSPPLLSTPSEPSQQLLIPNLSYRFGIHCGPCFGAVMGGDGAVFDLVGDMVNMSSRMMTTAEDKTIQYSLAVHHLLPPKLQEVATLRTAVKVKGKGSMSVYKINEDSCASEEGLGLSSTVPSSSSFTDLMHHLQRQHHHQSSHNQPKSSHTSNNKK